MIFKKKDYQVYQVLTRMLEACKDEIEVLIEKETDNKNLIKRIRKSIDEVIVPEEIEYDNIMVD